ncbi:hypothetical protein HID58_058948 [Brassica napus]|uniref:Zinc finger A20 and AN1 domain-containing stress-associated protein 4 n=1 Tax=Brassica napus TaxID=3708 RepID=A0ABQ7ZRI1_BRANA|nr:zinc finger A20 and AN1 domain-containing stress-associated protein 4-like [Brassica napus]KAH0882852.1 hypothetical protein HID58_058948 [Brassica napus]
MAEEHRCQTPEGHRLCVNNCGFSGSSATMNLCSNCYGDLCLNQQQASSLPAASPPSSSKIESISSSSTAERQIKLIPSEQKQPPQRPNRCTVCRKRVGLTGFMCRCGTTFCGTHRYPEVHGCTFDFKSAGREEIAKANPLVIAAKLQKI